MDYPKLRYIETFPVEHNDAKMVCLRDPQNTAGKMLLVSPEALYIISHFDGKNSILDIQSAIIKRYGNIIYKEQITELIHQLDEALLLDSENYRVYYNCKLDEFNSAVVRKSSHAGLSYPADERELNNWIDGYFAEVRPGEKTTGNQLKGLISPHIDFSRGGKSYARIYGELFDNQDCETFIIFGTSHYADVQNPFIVSRKNYSTPYGEVIVNQSIVDKIEKTCDWNIYEGEIFHRDEHSIEFQLVFLQYVLKNRKFNIVPVLCSSLYKFIRDGVSPIQNKRISVFLNQIRACISESRDKALIIAGADLAHVGLKFGDEDPVNEHTLRWIKQRDMLSINYSENLDAEGFYRSVEEEKDKRKICGLSPIYALLNTVDARIGKMVDYSHALEPETGSVVSYASVAFY